MNNQQKLFHFPDLSRITCEEIHWSGASGPGFTLYVLRLDKLHPEISGNKWFKLKYNIREALRQGKDTLLTFGGARSNHIAATAAAAPLFGLKSIGYIRGDSEQKGNPTLRKAAQNKMELHFLDRTTYRKKEDPDFLEHLASRFPNAFIVPEGGKNEWGVKGTSEILDLVDPTKFSHICCPVGTGGTLAGLLEKTLPNQQIVGFCALKKAEEQRELVQDWVKNSGINAAQWEIKTDYSFGGFAKRPAVLETFMSQFERETGIVLDFIYTAKMFFGIRELAQKGFFPPGSRVLALHTGGLQGNEQRAEE